MCLQILIPQTMGVCKFFCKFFPVVRFHHAERDAYCTTSSTLVRTAERRAKLSVQYTSRSRVRKPDAGSRLRLALTHAEDAPKGQGLFRLPQSAAERARE